MLFTLKVSNIMTEFIIKKLPYDLSSHAGLAFVGKYLKRTNLNALVDPAFPVRSGVANSEILSLKVTWPCCVWAKTTSTPSRIFGATPFSCVLLGLSAFLLVPPYVSVWTPMLLPGLIWPLE